MIKGVKLSSQIQKVEGGYHLVGEVDFATVPQIWKDSESIYASSHNGSLVIDLSAVTRADSAGLALLVGWVRRGNAAGVTTVFKDIPEQLLAIARVSGVENMLPTDQSAH